MPVTLSADLARATLDGISNTATATPMTNQPNFGIDLILDIVLLLAVYHGGVRNLWPTIRRGRRGRPRPRPALHQRFLPATALVVVSRRVGAVGIEDPHEF